MKLSKSLRTRSAGIAAIAAAALVLSACGPDTSGGGSGSDGGDAVDYEGVEPATEVTFWTNHPGASIELEKEIIAKFEAETGITVNHVTAGANYEEVAQKFQTGQVSGDAGDLVVLSDANWFTQYLNGSITPVDSILEALGEETDSFVPALYNDYNYDGVHWAVPYARSTPLFYYNKDVYEQAGITEAPSTWEDVAENARKIQDLGTIGFAYPEESEYPAWTMANLVWGYGGAWSNEWDLSTLTSDETVSALTFAQGLVNEGAAAVVSGDPSTAFSAGAAGQVIASTGSLRGILEAATFEVGAAFLPAGPAADSGIVPTGGAGLAVSAASSPEKQLAAAKLATYLNNAENTAFFSAGTGYLPVRTNADMSSVYAENPLFEVAVEQLELTRSQDFARVFIPGGDRVLAQNLQKILSSGADVAATLEAAQTEIQANFDRDLKDKVG
ncbi:carbohydrate ABC transporter substrate-binding protein, CUT1 family [Ruaniaceae bacterium KH17]|nr:carbohydrate ABC transporter substrate-binding protein, CUT1 family [Ruaniaceae bacterium KH17]